ncbi:hypothetical protein CRYUN_Cryun05aG0110100 [Craigia yunnanensis]
MANFFSQADVTSSGCPVLLHSEVEFHLLSSVDIEPEEHHHFPPLKSGLLILTTHRLLWFPSSSATTPAAIPLPAISHIFSSKKSLKSMFHSPSFNLNLLFGCKSKAKEMVMLAEKMRQKLLSGTSSQTSGTNDEDMGSKEEMQDWLLSVGIVSPVTKESAGALYHQQLSRQILLFLCY